MRATRLVRSLAVLVTAAALGGCVTEALWDAVEPPAAAAATAPTPAVPLAAVRAVRTGDGALHVLARYSDGGERRIVVVPLEAAPVTSGAWPEPGRRWPDLPRVEQDATLPAGVPVPCRGSERAALAQPDPAVSVLVGDLPDPGAEAVVAIEAGEVRLLSPAGVPTTLARFPRPPRRPPAAPTPRAGRATRAIAALALTPVTLTLDLALGAAALAVLAPFSPFLVLGLASGW